MIVNRCDLDWKNPLSINGWKNPINFIIIHLSLLFEIEYTADTDK